jgi:hypothetical protein
MITTISTLALVPSSPRLPVEPNDSIGVDLVLSLNASTLKVGQTLDVGVSILNTRTSLNSLPAAKDWPFTGVPVAPWGGCNLPTPAYAVLFKGNYSLQQVESLANVTFTIQCAESATVDDVVFLSNSSQVILTGSSGNGFGPLPGPYQLSLNFTTSGYWDLQNNSEQFLNAPIIGQQCCNNPPIATPFTPGVYTIAVSDGWGEAAILQFTVTSG